ncbi:hypothetical protein BB558_007147 [Smittium angustum]|uniref:RING-type domain-containing protein n=1 Tax=Smittium angustum TaxID=133377 RepID=A0A2U1IVU6_SMIAN|nr:hypothetical protein BB558_007258 [Smittium angustum]PVZ96923.1 hypothetical protein BB558_007147 [Smittium angustum]
MSLLISFITVLLFYPFLISSQFTVTSNAFPQPTPPPGPISSTFAQPGLIPTGFSTTSTAFGQPNTPLGPVSTSGGFSSVNGPISTRSFFTTSNGLLCFSSSFNGTAFPVCTSPNNSTRYPSGGSSFSFLSGGVIAILVLVSLRFVFYYLRIRNQPLNQPHIINMQPSNVGRNKKKKITLTQEELESYSIIKLEDFISQTAKVSSSLPLPPNSLEKEQPHSYIEIGEDVECMICFEQINMDDDVRVIPCYHVFHSQCLDTWLTTQSCVCPTCRLNLKTVNDEDNTNTNGQQTPPPNTTTYQMPRPNS